MVTSSTATRTDLIPSNIQTQANGGMEFIGSEVVSPSQADYPNLHYHGECTEARPDVAIQEMHMIVNGPKREHKVSMEVSCETYSGSSFIQTNLQKMSVTYCHFNEGGLLY